MTPTHETYTQYSIKLEPLHHFLWYWTVGATGSSYNRDSFSNGYAVTRKAALRRANRAVARKRRAEYYLV